MQGSGYNKSECNGNFIVAGIVGIYMVAASRAVLRYVLHADTLYSFSD